MGGRGAASASRNVEMPGSRGYGVASADGRMKKAVAYHGSFAEFDAFDASFSNERHQAWGGGFYLASSPETAKLYGDNVYEVEISYSTDLRTAKRHGRETDFHYNPDTGYWVIPHAKAGNLRILRKTRA